MSPPAATPPSKTPAAPLVSPTPDKTLYLIDGHAQIFRAYFAIRGGMNSPITGEPTQAVFGFAAMLFKFFSACQPRHAVMAIDLPGKTFRDELYPAYKAQRPPVPADLPGQEKRIFDLTKQFGLRVIGVPGAEADDVIATLTQRLLDDPARSDWAVRIVSKDKDLEQLLGERVAMYDIHTDHLIDPAALRAEKGITPAQVVDTLALMGDAVDNVPGVPGIGPKTAAQLIGEYGSIDNILAHLDQLKGKRRENLEKSRDVLPLSRQLVTLKRDVEVPLTLDDATIGRPDGAGLRQLFHELGFNRHRAELDKFLTAAGVSTTEAAAAVSSPTMSAEQAFPTGLFDTPAEVATLDKSGPKAFDVAQARGHGVNDQQDHPLATAPSTPSIQGAGGTSNGPRDYRAITTAEELRRVVAEAGGQALLAVDTETIGLGHRAELCGISLSWGEGAAVYIPVRAPAGEPCLDLATVREILSPLLAGAVGKCGHNLKYDWLVLRHAGMPLRSVVFDSMIASHLLGLPLHGLDHLAEQYFQHTMMQISELIGDDGKGVGGLLQKTMDQAPLDRITPYACDDAEVSWRLCKTMEPRLSVVGMAELSQRVEMPLVEVLAEMEYHGVRVEPRTLDEQKGKLADRIEVVRREIHELAGGAFNIDSPKQLADVLFNQLKLPVVKRTKTGPSTDSEVLETLAEREDVTPEQGRLLQRLGEYRQITKLVSTYLDALKKSIHPATGRVHATFHQTGAATGRLSSSDPNLQNIPIRSEIGRQVRRAFIADPGNRLICADYSQIELRLLAHLSLDAGLLDAFAHDQDIHTAVAAQVFHVAPEQVTKAQRAQAKIVNFGIVYGVTPYGLSRQIDGMTLEAARQLIGDYKQRFAGIGAFLDQCVAQAEQLGYVTTMLGRRRSVPQIHSANPNQRNLGQRLAINSVVQGSAADLIKLAMVNLARRLRRDWPDARLILQIHDELVLEAPAEQADALAKVAREEMEQAMTLKAPLKADVGIGSDWLEAKG